MANLPIFAVGAYKDIQPMIDRGVLSYPAFIVTTDEEHKNRLVFLDKELSLRMITGDGSTTSKEVIRVTELPDVEDGDIDVLYIYDNMVYVFTGSEYRSASLNYDEIETAVNNYLEEHPVEPTPIDDTLSISGEAADAKAVGDAINTLKGSIDEFPDLIKTVVSESAVAIDIVEAGTEELTSAEVQAAYESALAQ